MDSSFRFRVIRNACICFLLSLSSVPAQSGTVTFTGSNRSNLGTILHDGTSSNDIAGIQLDILGAMSSADAANRIHAGSFPFFSDKNDINLDNPVFVPIDLDTGFFTENEDHLPRILVIASHDGSSFDFQGIYVGDYLGSDSLIKFEGFRDGASTGSVLLTIGEANRYQLTFDRSNGLTASIFQNVDEVRISNEVHVDNKTWGIYAGFNNIKIGPAVPAPTVTGLSPMSGPSAGGTSVTITGTNLTGVTAVKFGTTNATGVVVNSATSVTATAPAGTAGSVDVTVTTGGGTSATSSADKFTYVAAPAVTGVAPSSGTTAGGTSVTITGANFTGTTAVKFGTANATSYAVSSATSITATSPAGSAGAVDVTVTTGGGTSATSSADRFTYVAPASASTSAASSVTSNSATLNGSGTPNGYASIGYFRYSTTNPGVCNNSFGTRSPATGGTDLGLGTAGVPFGAAITGLASGTSYYYCAIVSNANGLAYGSVLSVTIPGAPSGTTTSAASSVTSSSAILNGAAVPNGATSRGYFRFSTTDPITCNDTFGIRATTADQDALLGSGTSAVEFSKAVSGLTPATKYYSCALGRNDFGVGAGQVKSFTTAAVVPTVSTGTYNVLGPTSATVVGSVNANNSAATDSVEYGTSTGYGTAVAASPAMATGMTAVSVGATLDGLSPNTTYHYRVKAVNSAGAAWGPDSSFTTPRVPQTISFGAIATQTYGTGFIKLSASATSGLPVVYSSSDASVVRISNDTAFLLSADTATVTASQAGDDTRAAASPVARKVTIAPKTLTVSGAAAGDKVYDGTTAATVTGAKLSGVVDSDDVALVPGTASFASKDTGTSKPVAVVGSRLIGRKAGNYALVEISGLAANIAARPITVTADAKTKIQGDADPALTYTTGSPLLSGDSWTGALVRDPGETAGNYAIRIGTLSAGGNYGIAYAGANLTIESPTPTAISIRPARPSAVSREVSANLHRAFASAARGRGAGRIHAGACDDSTSCLSLEVVLPEAADVSIAIFDNLGTPVISFDRSVPGREWNGLASSGDGRRILPVSWNLRSSSGEAVPSGVYLWRIGVAGESGRKLETVRRTGVK